MKKLITLLFIVAFGCTAICAQDAEVQKAVQRYKNMNTLTAAVKQTKHKAAVTKDAVTQGTFYFKKPDKMCMTFNGGKEVLLMNGNNFTMVSDGKKNTVQGKGNNSLESLVAVFKNMAAGDDSTIDLSELADVEFTKTSDLCTMTITPIAADAKAKRKMMFTSFVLTISLKSSELKSLRMNEKAGNYTQYDFSDYLFNSKVDDSVFTY